MRSLSSFLMTCSTMLLGSLTPPCSCPEAIAAAEKATTAIANICLMWHAPLRRNIFILVAGVNRVDGLCRSLVKNRLSDNVGGVKQLLGIPIRALGEERHFALVEMAVPTTGSLVIVFQVRTLGPTHASLRSLTAIMITTSNSSVKRS